ncbi:SpoIIE family protein phosphatase [Niameybacter massiliensis]|uniref:SpoIIE family protein phosphatase n=1 Tax=Holtiella tumoricola TaxID=3018743 RepID=A0AA42J1P2_9FIRM|nr:SpoIIE family protein phosphatase [Holtiella tumoricola]MDA3732782.1 SpoIIE family protein phosphatase [Holtiella tumoricola]
MNGVETKEKSPMGLKVKIPELIMVLMSFAFARVGFYEYFYTVGIAYVGSLYEKIEIRKWSVLFATLGVFSLMRFDVGTLKYVLMIGLISLVRKWLEMNHKECTLQNQLVSTFASIFLVDLLSTLIQGFNLYTCAICIVEALVGMALTYIFACGTSIILQRRQTPLTSKESISITIMLALAVAGALDFYISVPICKEIYFRDMVAYIILIAVTYLGGANKGVTMGIVMSSLLVIIGYISPAFVAIYALTALVGGVFLPIGKWGVILGGLIGQLVGFSIFNGGRLDWSLIGAYGIAAVISFIIPKNYFGIASWFLEKSIEQNEQIHLERIQRIMTTRLKHIVRGFEQLGDSFEKVRPKRMEFTPKDMRNIIEDTGEKLCVDCSMKQFCWVQDLKTTYQHAYEMIDTFKDKGFISEASIPPLFKEHCPNASNFAYVMSFKLDLLRQNTMWHNRFIENRALMAEQLKAVSTTLNSLVNEIEKEIYFNKEEENLLKENLLAQGIHLKDAMVLENKGKIQSIEIYTSKQDDDYPDIMASVIEDTLGYKVALESMMSREENYEYKWKIKNTYRVTAGYAICAKEEISGDVYTFMEVDDDQYLLALADGMGSGRVAYEESAATIEMLEDFMESGFRKDLAVRMINSALILNDDDEVFSTVDVTLIDRKTGMAEFLKAGAATSFILHDGDVMPIRMNSLPIGIVKDVDLEIKHVQLHDGDILIMITDGILEASGDILGKEKTFKHFILECKGQAPQYMADYLMEKSRDLLGVQVGDDMTIIVARIWKEH